ncbi:hypothetical protein GH733_010110, partial [Mirounga leonina]
MYFLEYILQSLSEGQLSDPDQRWSSSMPQLPRTQVRFGGHSWSANLDLMADVMYCPCSRGQLPDMREPSCTMDTCSGCNFSFYTLCRLTYLR